MLVLSIVLSVLASPSVLGQDAWVRAGAEWYLVSPERMTWFEAQEVCSFVAPTSDEIGIRAPKVLISH